jgi:hypothetical protein
MGEWPFEPNRTQPLVVVPRLGPRGVRGAWSPQWAAVTSLRATRGHALDAAGACGARARGARARGARARGARGARGACLGNRERKWCYAELRHSVSCVRLPGIAAHAAEGAWLPCAGLAAHRRAPPPGCRQNPGGAPASRPSLPTRNNYLRSARPRKSGARAPRRPRTGWCSEKVKCGPAVRERP